MQINDVLHGFRVVRQRENAELGGTLWELEHEKTGAQLAWVDNGNPNKLFSVAFKTLPWDDTGVFHILEHSVLAGSESYPVKEPFLDLLKSSMNTFLNAMTFPDKTMYPVSSRNDKDFMNLTRVYLDAVFKPAIYTNPNIFYQEGWHYEIREPEAEPLFKGVVFNEMKGAFASVSELMDCGIRRLIFPDSVYGFVSGGDPEKIPDLTYERFLDAHREFYHPSNARFYLDGNVPLEQTLGQIDAYLSGYDKNEAAHEIALQGAVPAAYAEETYPLGAEEDAANKCQIGFGRVLGNWSERKKLMAFGVLATYLTGSNDAPLTKALLEKGLAQNVTLFVEDGIAEPYMNLIVRDTEKENLSAIRDTVRKVLTSIVEQGIDPAELDAILALEEYSIRDMEEPAGLIRNITGLNSWLYGGDILQYLVHGETVAAVKAEVGTAYFTELIREFLLDEAHLSTFVLTPSKTKRQEIEEKERARLLAAKATWTAEDTAAYIRKNALLDDWQASEDSEEARATLPTLDISDVDPAPVFVQTEKLEADGVPVWFHPVPSNGITHVRAYYSVNDVPFENLADLRILTALLGELPTKRHTVSELQLLRRRTIGDLDFSIGLYPDRDRMDRCRVAFTVAVSALTEKLSAAAALVHEIMTETDFSDGTKIRELLLQEKNAVNRSLLSRGNTYAISRAASTLRASAAAAEETSGYASYCRIKDFCEHFDAQIGDFRAFAEQALSKLYVADRLILSCTGDRYAPDAAAFVPARHGAADAPFMERSLPAGKTREAILIPSGVSYAAKVWQVQNGKTPYTGTLSVLSTILSYGYLWGEIRIKGGAYGCGFRAPVSGMTSFYSYRDPAPVEAIGTFNATPDFLRDFADGDEDAQKYVISTVANNEPLLEPAAAGEGADRLLFTGRTFEDAVRFKQEVLSTDKNAIASFIPYFEALAENGNVCIVGSDTKLSGLDEDWKKYTV